MLRDVYKLFMNEFKEGCLYLTYKGIHNKNLIEAKLNAAAAACCLPLCRSVVYWSEQKEMQFEGKH